MPTSLRNAEQACAWFAEQVGDVAEEIFIAGQVACRRPCVTVMTIGLVPRFERNQMDFWNEFHDIKDLFTPRIDALVEDELIEWSVDDRGARRSTDEVLRLWHGKTPLNVHLLKEARQRGVAETRLTGPPSWWKDVLWSIHNFGASVEDDLYRSPWASQGQGWSGENASREFLETFGMDWVDPWERRVNSDRN